MIFAIMALVAIIHLGMTTCKRNQFNEDYCSHKDTTTVNAICSIMIFLSHGASYIELYGPFDEAYYSIIRFISQGVVVTYLFYSGYGIMTSIQKKGYEYVKAMPKNRLLKTWLHFAIIIIMFIISGLAVGRKYDFVRYLKAFIGLKSIGNSCWYMFVTLSLYIIVIVAFMIFRKSNIAGLIASVILTVGFVYLEKEVLELHFVFYDTIFCFPLGMIFAVLKPHIDKKVMKNDKIWFTTLCVLFILFLVIAYNRRKSIYVLMVFYGLMPLLITLLMMKIRIRSSVLDWFGNHIFSFFMLQRIPMMILYYLGWKGHRYLFLIICFILSMGLAYVYDLAIAKLDNALFKKKTTTKPYSLVEK